MAKHVEFYFDVGSPASYLAWTQLPSLCHESGATLVYKPMLLDGVFQATGNTSPAAVPAKARYMNQDLQRHSRLYGVPLVMNPHFPIITLLLMRVVTGVALREPARLQDLLAVLFKALWVDALDLNQPAVVARVLSDAGFEPTQMQAWAADPEIKTALKTVTEEAVARGVFGAPTMFAGDEMFFGQDRLDRLRATLAH